MTQQETEAAGWNADDSQTFTDYGKYFVPEREVQIATMAALIPPRSGGLHVLELACGEGLLAEAILERFPAATVHGYDGAPEMLRAAGQRLAHFGSRFQTRRFDLADVEWRRPAWPVHAVLSSLTIHHLAEGLKAELFRDVYEMLEPGGAFIIADVIKPAGSLGQAVAAEAWDEAVRLRSEKLDGNRNAFEHFKREQWNMYRYFDPADIDKPSHLFDQLKWLEQVGFTEVDVYWMQAGHAIFGGRKADG